VLKYVRRVNFGNVSHVYVEESISFSVIQLFPARKEQMG
jgi:hypothetical protein